MENLTEDGIVIPTNWKSVDSMIKVIGVGGGGCNAVSYMYNQKIEGCTFIVCNTDAQALESSPVPEKIQLGKGLGAGCDPTEGRNAALEAVDQIKQHAIDNGTEMLFITAGMGGGTGTGAAPVIANLAKQAGILTVAVVTLPFENERNASMSKAIDGIRELEKNVDSLIIINNQKLYECYGNLKIYEAFPKTDEVLATAVKGIIDIIQKKGYINVDFKDVKKMMKDSGLALMGCGTSSGENRIEEAVTAAMQSPLLNDFNLKTAKNFLVNITTGKNEDCILMEDLGRINDMISGYTGDANNFKTGIVFDNSDNIGDKISITVIATGFKMDKLGKITDVNLGRIIEIDENYRYNGVKNYRYDDNSDKSIVETPKCEKIGFTDSNNKRKFVFNEKPVLIVSSNEDKSELENCAAIRRKNNK